MCFLFPSGDCSAAPDDLQCTLCQTAGIKQASCSSPAAFRCKEKPLHFLYVSVWVCGAEGPAVDRLSWLSILHSKVLVIQFSWMIVLLSVMIQSQTVLAALKLLWFHLLTEIHIIFFCFLTYYGSFFAPYAHHVLKTKWFPCLPC